MGPTFKLSDASQDAFWGILGGILGGPITEFWGQSPQYSIMSLLESPQDSLEDTLEGFQKLKRGPILGQSPLSKTNEKHPYATFCVKCSIAQNGLPKPFRYIVLSPPPGL